MSLEHSPARQRHRGGGRVPLPRVALTINEFAAATGISRASLYRMMIDGQLRYVQLGERFRRIPATEIKRLFGRVEAEV
jgi:excisionase family DNA binding protein